MKADMPSSGADWEALADVMSNEPVSVLADTVNERGEEGRVPGRPEKKDSIHVYTLDSNTQQNHNYVHVYMQACISCYIIPSFPSKMKHPVLHLGFLCKSHRLEMQ